MQTFTNRAKAFLESHDSSCASAKTEQRIVNMIAKVLFVGMVVMVLMSLKDIARYIRIKSM